MPRLTRKNDDVTLLGQALRELREERRLSQGELAAASGVEGRRIRALEDGRLDPDYVMLLALAKALGVRAGALVIRAEKLAAERTSREP